MNWISIETRLPDAQNKVLVITEQGNVEPSEFDGKEFSRYRNDAQGDRCLLYHYPRIKFWMPFPEPPKEKVSIVQAFNELRETGMGDAWDKVTCVCAELGRGKCDLNCPDWYE